MKQIYLISCGLLCDMGFRNLSRIIVNPSCGSVLAPVAIIALSTLRKSERVGWRSVAFYS